MSSRERQKAGTPAHHSAIDRCFKRCPPLADKFSGTLDDVFDIQEKVYGYCGALRLRLTQSEDEQIAKKPLVDMRAYDCYLRAPGNRSFTDEGFEEAKRLLRAA